MIKQLSEEQESKIKEYYNTYLAKGLSTKPSNKPIAEKAIKQMYKLMGEKELKIVWVKSPTELIYLVQKQSFHSSFHSSLYSSLYSSLNSSLNSSPYSSFHSSLDSSLYSSLYSSLSSSLYSSLLSSLSSSLSSSLHSSLLSSLYSSLDFSLSSSLVWGQTNANWICFFKYCNEVLGIKYKEKEVEKLNLWVGMMECVYFFVFKNITILMEHPKEIHLDHKNLNHNLSDFAIKWYDNTGIYVVHGEIVKELNIKQLFKDKKITNLEYLAALKIKKVYA